jgi:hypothetical protein
VKAYRHLKLIPLSATPLFISGKGYPHI